MSEVQLFTILSTLLVGILTGVGVAYLSGFVKEYFAERARKSKHKREVARHILRICHSSIDKFSALGVPTDNLEDFERALNDLEMIDSEMAQIFERYIKVLKSGSFIIVSFRKELESLKKKLIEWANEIRFGK